MPQRYEQTGGRVREVVFENCGHSPHVERTVEFADVLAGLVAQAAAGRTAAR